MNTSSQRADVVIAGHVCLDVIPSLPGPLRNVPGGLQRIGPADITTGGAVPNVGLALHRLGVPVQMVGKVGDDVFGRAVLDVLNAASKGLANSMIVERGVTTSYSLVFSEPDVDRFFLHHPGANDDFGLDDFLGVRASEARVLHFGYPPLMRRMYAAGGDELRSLFSHARSGGLATTLDMALPDERSDAAFVDWTALLRTVLPVVDVFFPSIQELLFMLDRAVYDVALQNDQDVSGAIRYPLLRSLADQCLAMGAAVVVIKLGQDGLYVRSTADAGRLAAMCRVLQLDVGAWLDFEVLSPCFQPAIVAGTTGAGDCTIAGFIAALTRGESLVESATAATAVGACCVEQSDATSGLCSWSQILLRRRKGWPRLPTRLGANQNKRSLTTLEGTTVMKSGQAS